MSAGSEAGSPDRFRAPRLEMVERDLRARRIVDPAVLRAFEEVPRELFVPADLAADAYADRPLPIGFDQTISQPFVVAFMCQTLEVEPGHRALEVGAGGGYATAILAALGARVFGLERIPELAARARESLERAGYGARATVLAGDGSRGLEEEAPFDRILVSAAARSVPPALERQLAPGGVLVAPVGGEKEQEIVSVRKTRDVLVTQFHGKCAFVKLFGEGGYEPPPAG